MKSPRPKAHGPVAPFRDDLQRLELKIAQRADQLSQGRGRAGGSNLEHWLQAEREVFARRPWSAACPL